MSFKEYLKDLKIVILLYIFMSFLICVLLYVFNSNQSVLLLIGELLLIFFIIFISYGYMRKRKFYKTFSYHLQSLDKKYLILETLERPEFYEGQFLFDSMTDINKSMNDEIASLSTSNKEFKDYIEMWIHELKTPLSAMSLYLYNHKENTFLNNEVTKMNHLADQILYYVRLDYSEKDYMIKKVNMKEIVHTLLLEYKDILLQNDIHIEVNIENDVIHTDEKWLRFILHQIMNNSISYKKENDSIISIDMHDNTLSITDNGIGIVEEDIDRVTQKSFTGTNGRIRKKSTGMGLYIVNQLCQKLGHQLKIESEVNKYTCVSIHFNENTYITEL